jgi:hypothetical protein
MNDHRQLTERLEALVDRDNQPDWKDVVRRAEAPAQAAGPARARRRRRSYLARRLVPAFVLAAAIIAVGLIAPWNHSPSFTERALAAIGDEPVIHAVVRSKTLFTEINLATGRGKPYLATSEFWYDSQRHIAMWKSGQAPGFEDDPYVAGFLVRYRSALEKGAKATKKGMLNGHEVIWFGTPALRIAVDNKSALPLRIEYHDPTGTLSWDVLSIETLPGGKGNLVPLKTSPYNHLVALDSQAAARTVPVSLSRVSKLLPGALWNGESFSGQSLLRITRMTLTTNYKGAPRDPREGIRMKYGEGWWSNNPTESNPLASKPFVRLDETVKPLPNGYWPYRYVPRSGSLISYCGLLTHHCEGFLVKNRIYVLVAASSRDLMLAAARALKPIQP